MIVTNQLARLHIEREESMYACEHHDVRCPDAMGSHIELESSSKEEIIEKGVRAEHDKSSSDDTEYHDLEDSFEQVDQIKPSNCLRS